VCVCVCSVKKTNRGKILDLGLLN